VKLALVICLVLWKSDFLLTNAFCVMLVVKKCTKARIVFSYFVLRCKIYLTVKITRLLFRNQDGVK